MLESASGATAAVASAVTVHFDLPTSPLIFNLAQQFAGWIASAEPLDVAQLRFVAEGQPLVVEFRRREDVERAMPGSWVSGWSCTLDTFALRRTARSVNLQLLLSDRLLYSRMFLKTRHLLPGVHNAPLFFMHVPKTAGTALRHIVDYAFASFPSLLVYGDAPGVSSDEVISTYNRFVDSREILFGHFDFALAQQFGGAEPKVITVLREPKAMVRSYLEFTPEPAGQMLDNPQVRHLCGLSYQEPFGLVTRQHLELALRRSASNCYMIQQDRLQEFADLLTRSFGLPPYRVERVNETVAALPAASEPVSVDLRYDTELYATCRNVSRDFFEFLDL